MKREVTYILQPAIDLSTAGDISSRPLTLRALNKEYNLTVTINKPQATFESDLLDS